MDVRTTLLWFNTILFLLDVYAFTSNSFTMGKKSKGDRLIYTEYVKVPKLSSRKLTREVNFPGLFEPKGIIHFIKGTDLNEDGHGANVTLINGGVNNRDASFLIKSQKARDIDFLFDVYGNDLSKPDYEAPNKMPTEKAYEWDTIIHYWPV